MSKGSLGQHFVSESRETINKCWCQKWHSSYSDGASTVQSGTIWALKNKSPGLPWWRSGWESACQCRGHGFEPWSGRIPHAVEQLRPWATITEPVLRNKRGRDGERPAHRDEEWSLLAATGESPCTETKTQHSHKLINLKKLKQTKKSHHKGLKHTKYVKIHEFIIILI